MINRHPFPHVLLALRHLRGGQFGTLDVTARNRHDVEVAVGGDFVTITRAEWIQLRATLDPFFDTGGESVVVIDEQTAEVIDAVVVTAPPRRRARG